MTDREHLRLMTGKNARKEINKLIDEIVSYTKEYLPENNREDYLKGAFDVSMQALLITAGATDTDFAPVEVEFIQKIATHYDLLELFNSTVDQKGIDLPHLDWELLHEVVNEFSPQMRQNFSTFLLEMVMEFSSLLCVCGAIAERESGKDLFRAFELLCSSIRYAFYEVDGDEIADLKTNSNPSLTRKYLCGNAVFNLLFTEKWKLPNQND